MLCTLTFKSLGLEKLFEERVLCISICIYLIINGGKSVKLSNIFTIQNWICYLNIFWNVIYFCDGKTEFEQPLLQCHMIIQKSLEYADLVLKKHVLLFTMFKTAAKYFCGNCDSIFFQDSLMNRKFKRTVFVWNINTNNALTITFDWFDVPCWIKVSISLNKKIHLKCIHFLERFLRKCN